MRFCFKSKIIANANVILIFYFYSDIYLYGWFSEIFINVITNKACLLVCLSFWNVRKVKELRRFKRAIRAFY